jgi:hypothetical protein
VTAPQQARPRSRPSTILQRSPELASQETAAPALRPLRVLPIPPNRPPVFTGSVRDLLTEQERPRYIQDALAVDFANATDEQVFGRQPTARVDLPDPRDWAAHLAQAIVEVMAGSRSAPQVIRWTTSEVYAVIARRHAVAARRAALSGQGRRVRAVVMRVIVCEPADGVAEASAVVIDGTRVRALAMRMVGQDGRWRVEALQVG